MGYLPLEPNLTSLRDPRHRLTGHSGQVSGTNLSKPKWLCLQIKDYILELLALPSGDSRAQLWNPRLEYSPGDPSCGKSFWEQKLTRIEAGLMKKALFLTNL